MSKPARFRQSDITRAAKALVKAGAKVMEVRFDERGMPVFVCGTEGAAIQQEDAGSWRDRLDKERAGWAK